MKKKKYLFILCYVFVLAMNENDKSSRNVAYLLEDVMQKKFDYGFYQEELWEYVGRTKKAVIEYEMEDVKHWIYVPCWSYEQQEAEECFISIYQVLLQSDMFSEHMHRIQHAELCYPLIVIEDDFDKYGVILDGNHRFAKSMIMGRKTVSVQVIGKDELMKTLYRKID